MQNISAHITYQEAIASATAANKGILNVPSVGVISAMQAIANNIFEPVRAHFGTPIKVSSFFRCAALNQAIGGASNSQHVKGQAIDMDGDVYGNPSNKQIFEFVRDNLKFDQLIVEGINNGKMDWVHCSCVPSGNRNQILFMYIKDGKKIYEPNSTDRYKILIH